MALISVPTLQKLTIFRQIHFAVSRPLYLKTRSLTGGGSVPQTPCNSSRPVENIKSEPSQSPPGGSGTETQTPAAAARTSCTPSEAPPCPPCVPSTAPSCRTSKASCPQGVRVVCCPPPAGQRPPCPPPMPNCPLTCDNAVTKVNQSAIQMSAGSNKQCGQYLDHVAQRLSAAECARRAHYEREVAEQPPPARPTPVTYRLAAERRCARATDGHDYILRDAPVSRSKQHCGPDREAPLACPVDLVAYDGCEIRSARHLDPCATKPRVFLSIDRSAAESESNKEDSKKRNQNESITTRLMDSFRLTKKNNDKSNQKPENNKSSWCKSPPSIKAAPTACREPSLTERLRQRTGRDKPCSNNRDFHTAPWLRNIKSCSDISVESSLGKTTSAAKSNQSDIDKLTYVLEERKKLKEAGRGRFMSNNNEETYRRAAKRARNSGVLELSVPAGFDSVKVRVTLDMDTNSQNMLLKNNMTNNEQTHNDCTMSTSEKNESGSWMSIKNLQKKLSEHCRKEVKSEIKCPAAPGAKPLSNNLPISSSKQNESKQMKKEAAIKEKLSPVTSPCPPPPPGKLK
ncbi:uncharacterized protein LOC126968932 [Leptidea sinapis]|uniref:uncharacterized protein LOC126968932 n=1 Tax=Leptidea sinapis TaxID=189913 RepID=UPI00212DC617|nr:uncharacterized protein LOC126968932 [Leptidea sinapis]